MKRKPTQDDIEACCKRIKENQSIVSGEEPKKTLITSKNETKNENNKTIVFSFGTGEDGQLGRGNAKLASSIPRIVPWPVPICGVVKVCAGALHTAIIDQSGGVWTFGCNDEGALGRDGNEFTPSLISMCQSGYKFQQASCGASHTLVLSVTGELFGCGSYRSQRGLMDYPDGEQKKIKSWWKWAESIKLCASGDNHDVFASYSDEIFEIGNIGLSLQSQEKFKIKIETKDHENGNKTSNTLKLKKIKISAQVCNLFAGGQNSAFLKKDGTCWIWGLSNMGQCGMGRTTDIEITVPQQITFIKDIQSIAFGFWHTIFLTKSGQVWSVGKGFNGCLGLGEDGKRFIDNPQRISSLSQIVQISASEGHSIAIDSLGRVWTWGTNDNKQLGHGAKSFDEIYSPTLISSLPQDFFVFESSAGSSHSILASVKKSI